MECKIDRSRTIQDDMQGLKAGLCKVKFPSFSTQKQSNKHFESCETHAIQKQTKVGFREVQALTK